MVPCRSSAIDSAFRTRTSPRAPLKLDTMNASVAQLGPSVTLTLLLLFSWSSVDSAKVYEPSMSPVCMAEVKAATSGAPLKSISPTSGFTDESQYESFRTVASTLPGFHDSSLYGPVHIAPPLGVP